MVDEREGGGRKEREMGDVPGAKDETHEKSFGSVIRPRPKRTAGKTALSEAECERCRGLLPTEENREENCPERGGEEHVDRMRLRKKGREIRGEEEK